MTREPTWLVKVERVHEMHALAIAQWGGLPGIRDRDCPRRSVEASLTAALYAMEAIDDEPDPLTVSVHLLFYLARNHCYSDGNKRVAWLTFVEQLAVVGLDIEATQQEVELFVVEVAGGNLDVAAMSAWVAPRLTALVRA